MNEDKFTGKAASYAKYRPTYPAPFIQYLYTQVGFRNDSRIADIGSGTGILTEQLLRQGSLVYGVEPNADMRGAAESALSRYPNFLSVDGSAEHTGLADSGVDFITVAQAFHWFDPAKFQEECRRVLKGNGKVVLVWNSRDTLSPILRENDEINRRYCPGYQGFSGGVKMDTAEEFSDFFRGGVCECRVFPNDLFVDEEAFIGRSLSSSYSPKEGTERYLPYVSALRSLFEKYSRSGSLPLPNLTRSFVGEV